MTIAGCALSALNAVLAIAMLVCVWFVVRDLVAVAPAWGEARQAPVYGAWALAFALAGLVVYFAALMCTHLAAFRTATNMRKAALEHLAKVPLGYFSVRSTGELRRVIEGSTGLTEGVLAHRIPDFVGALVTPVAYLVVMFVFDWVMGLVCLIPVLASAFCMFLMMGGGLGGKDGEGNSNAMQFMVNYQNALDKMNKAAVEYVRGILKDAPIVVLDEATAFADPENEALIQRALGVLCAGKTVLMIAHRLSTVAGADAIYVLDGGRLAEQGTHAELVEAGGLYARMWADYRTSAQWRIGKEGGYAA